MSDKVPNPSEEVPLTVLHHGGCHMVSVRSDVQADWFDPNASARSARPIAQGGRGAAWFVDLDHQQAVLRYFRRGGWIAHLTQTLYVWQGLKKTRSFKEFYLMRELDRLQLPVAKVIAAQVQRVGLFFYRAALLTQRIEGARSLSTCEDRQIWYRAGVLIRQMHQLGVWHADLNVHNILVDDQDAIWLIDFDRAQYPVHDEVRLAKNIERLARSVAKVCPDKRSQHWPVLCEGYDYDPVSSMPVMKDDLTAKKL